MKTEVIKVGKENEALLEYIITNLRDTSAGKPAQAQADHFLADDRSYLLAAVQGAEVIGYALAYRFPSLATSGYLAYLYDIEVLERHRRKGVGRLLVEALLSHLKSDGVAELWLGTATDNVAGQALFSATGGEKSGETFNDFIYDLTGE